MAEKKQDRGSEEPQEIDLGQVANAEAVQEKDPSFEEAQKSQKTSTKRKKKNSKFNFVESEPIPLPSGGRLYQSVTEDEDILKHGHIRMLPMGLKEEEILSTQKFLKAGIATRMILDSCIESNIDAQDILLFDSNFLMFYLRSISYGDEYTFQVKCQNPACENKFNHTVNISELAFEELPSDLKEPLKIKLPVSQYTVQCVLPRLFHSEEIYMRNNKRKKSSEDANQRLRDNMVVTSVKILDDEGDELPEGDWEEFFEALPGKDIAELRDKTTFNTGVDNIEDLTCPYCEETFDTNIPIGAEFFRF